LKQKEKDNNFSETSDIESEICSDVALIQNPDLSSASTSTASVRKNIYNYINKYILHKINIYNYMNITFVLFFNFL